MIAPVDEKKKNSYEEGPDRAGFIEIVDGKVSQRHGRLDDRDHMQNYSDKEREHGVAEELRFLAEKHQNGVQHSRGVEHSGYAQPEYACFIHLI